MGTVNLLEAVRRDRAAFARWSASPATSATRTATTDAKPYVESDAMGGYDPYSSSKGCAELVTSALRRSFFNPDDA